MMEVRDQVQVLLQSLSAEERQLLGRVLRLEHDQLHLQRPRIKEELVRATREIIK